VSSPTTNMSLSKAQDADNAETYLVTNLGASLDTIDAHRHRGGTSGLLVDTLSASQASGDLFYATGANALSRLAIGSANSVLTSSGSAPQWTGTVFTAFSPTIAQNGSAVTATVLNARYLALGKLAVVLMAFQITAAGTVGTDISIESVAAAVAPKSTSNAVVGSGVYQRVAGNAYPCAVMATSATQMKMMAGPSNTFLGNSPSFATANGDLLLVTLSYEIA